MIKRRYHIAYAIPVAKNTHLYGSVLHTITSWKRPSIQYLVQRTKDHIGNSDIAILSIYKE